MEDLIQNLQKICSLIKTQLNYLMAVCVLMTCFIAFQTACIMIKVNGLDGRAARLEKEVYHSDVALEKLMYEVDKLIHEGGFIVQGDQF